MANAGRGEVALDVPFDKDRTDHFVLKFSNAGHRSMEDFLDLESSQILRRINSGMIGTRIVTGLFWGATRKFHARDFASIDDIDDYLDEIDDEAEDANEAGQTMLIALIAAYTKSNPSDIEAAMLGEDNTESSNGAGPKASGRGKAKAKAPAKKAKPAPKATKSEASDSGESS